MSSELEITSNKFNSLITQYQETYQDFLNTINSNNNNFKTVIDSAYIGENNVNTINDSSIDNCLSSCKSNEKCSGATFDDKLNSCTLTTGVGNIVNSENKTAIVREALYYSNRLKELNTELLSLNNSLIENTSVNMNEYLKTENTNNQKADILKQNYKTLENERIEIEEIIKQYQTLNAAYENGNIIATSNYYYYMFYLLIAIVLVFLFLKINTSDNQSGGGRGHITVSPLLLIFLSLVIIFNAYLKN
jgi:hypothetical protein